MTARDSNGMIYFNLIEVVCQKGKGNLMGFPTYNFANNFAKAIDFEFISGIVRSEIHDSMGI